MRIEITIGEGDAAEHLGFQSPEDATEEAMREMTERLIAGVLRRRTSVVSSPQMIRDTVAADRVADALREIRELRP